jgi:ribosomal protein S12 methylthiotransferase accessory factor YcaO
LARQPGNQVAAATAWRELAQGRFPALAGAAQRHLAEP